MICASWRGWYVAGKVAVEVYRSGRKLVIGIAVDAAVHEEFIRR
jgi:hypothetical protein